MKNAGTIGAVEYLIVEKDDYTGFICTLDLLIKERNLEGHVSMREAAFLTDLYRGVDAFILLSFSASLSLVVFELHASGLPIITMRSLGIVQETFGSDLADYVHLVDVYRPAAVSSAILEMRDLRGAFSCTAISGVVSGYSWRAVAERYFSMRTRDLKVKESPSTMERTA